MTQIDISALRPPVMRAMPFALLIGVAALGSWALGDALSFENLSAHRDTLTALRDAHYVPAVAAFMLAYIAIVAFSLPGATIGTLTGGFLFGVGLGAGYVVIAATIGAVLIFLAARYGFGAALSARMDASNGTIRRIKEGLDENQWSVLFLIRLIPVIPFFVANILPALVNVPLRRYAISTFFGIMPGAFVYASVGAGLGDVFERGERPNLGIIFEPYVLFPLLGLAALALVPVLARYVWRPAAL